MHQQGIFLDPIELPQGIVGVGEKDIIQITVQNRIGIRGLRPRQGLQGNHAPQPEEGLGEDEVLLLAADAVLDDEVPILLDTAEDAIKGCDRVLGTEVDGAGHLHLQDLSRLSNQGSRRQRDRKSVV